MKRNVNYEIYCESYKTIVEDEVVDEVEGINPTKKLAPDSDSDSHLFDFRV